MYSGICELSQLRIHAQISKKKFSALCFAYVYLQKRPQ